METIEQIPFVQIQPARRWLSVDLKELWAYRELIYFLIWRDIKVRYKQTAIGAAWAVLQPLMMMLVFTILFQYIAKIQSEGIPYPVFAYTALLPWTLFSSALTRCAASVAQQANLVSKVYFPRLITPLSATVSGVVDLAIGFAMLAVMLLWYRIMPTWGVLALPAFFCLALLTALAVGLWLSALYVKYRDVGHTIPFLVQLWMYASPVAYSASEIPERWRLFYGLNPLVGVIEGFRWALLGTQSPDFRVIAVSVGCVFVLLFGGVVYFQRMERSFADII